MKKKLLFLLIFNLIINVNFVFSESDIPSNVPGGDIVGKIDIDPETGQPQTITNIEDKYDQFKNQNSSYFRAEWGKILANNKFFGPFLNSTDKFFSFFNPLWRYSFGMEFSWSLMFFFHVLLWIALVILIYFPAKEMFNGNLFAGLITGIIIASIVGSVGIITNFANLLDTAFVKLWQITLIFVIIIVLIVLYAQFFKKADEESEEEKLKRAQENIKAHGKVSEKFLDNK